MFDRDAARDRRIDYRLVARPECSPRGFLFRALTLFIGANVRNPCSSEPLFFSGPRADDWTGAGIDCLAKQPDRAVTRRNVIVLSASCLARNGKDWFGAMREGKAGWINCRSFWNLRIDSVEDRGFQRTALFRKSMTGANRHRHRSTFATNPENSRKDDGADEIGDQNRSEHEQQQHNERRDQDADCFSHATPPEEFVARGSSRPRANGR